LPLPTARHPRPQPVVLPYNINVKMIPNQMVDKRGFIDSVCTCFTSSYFSNPFMVKTAKLCAFFRITEYLLKETPYGLKRQSMLLHANKTTKKCIQFLIECSWCSL
jgi:hypothetical protein